MRRDVLFAFDGYGHIVGDFIVGYRHDVLDNVAVGLEIESHVDALALNEGCGQLGRGELRAVFGDADVDSAREAAFEIRSVPRGVSLGGVEAQGVAAAVPSVETDFEVVGRGFNPLAGGIVGGVNAEIVFDFIEIDHLCLEHAHGSGIAADNAFHGFYDLGEFAVDVVV